MSSSSANPRLLIISQVYVPDPASVGQHMADAASELVKRGYDVRVLTSGRGYADPTVKYPPRETLDGVEVIPLASNRSRLVHATAGGHSGKHLASDGFVCGNFDSPRAASAD